MPPTEFQDGLQKATAARPQSPGTGPSPFQQVILRLAQDGLQLKKSIDTLTLTEASRLVNAVPVMGGQLLTRAGQTSLATAAGNHHSISRLNNPQGANFTRFIGAGTQVYRGTTGALGSVASGFSGNPISFLPFRPPLSGQSWMFICDTNKMIKAPLTGNTLPWGLPVPATPTTAIYATYTTSLASFSASDGTNAAAWGTAALTGGGNPPNLSDDPSNLAVVMTTEPGGATGAFTSLMGINRFADLSTLAGGTVAATDQDELHFRIWANDPGQIDEIRLYIVLSQCNRTLLPGTDLTYNTDAFVKSFRPNDFQSFVSLTTNTAIDVGAQVRVNNLLDQYSTDNANGSTAPAQDIGSFPSLQMSLGAQARAEYGVIGLPLRRADFTRIGSDPTLGWNTITGIIITVALNSNVSTDIQFQLLYLTGGAGLDSAEPGDIQYDYRVTNYDPRTGAESNPSNVMAAGAFLDSNRQPIIVTPPAFGDSGMRQRIYRRGGTITDDWFFCGTNTADGATFIDGIDTTQNPIVATNDDTEIIAAGAVEIDNDQPVTTVDANGNAVFNQPLRNVWGPVAGMILGCGDPYRPGAVYWSKPGQPEAWPSANWVEVCAPSEELMNGGVWGGQAFVFSRERAYVLNTNLTGVTNGFVATPTDCVPGMASYWGLCIGPDGVYYVAKDGVRATSGDTSQVVSDQLRPLFNGQAKNGINPIDFTQASAIRLTSFNNDIWFKYVDIISNTVVLVYSVLYRMWRQVIFGQTPVAFYSEPTQADAGTQLLIGGAGALYTHTGQTDAGAAISCEVRTGALDFGYTWGNTIFGDVVVDADMQQAALNLTVLFNNETTVNPILGSGGFTGRHRYVWDAFGNTGDGPQQARNISLDLTWQGNTGSSPIIELAGISMIQQPNVTMNRVTSWDSSASGEAYLTGIWVDCNTGTSSRSVHVEYDLNGVIAEPVGSPFTINPTGVTGRHKWWLSWPVVKANIARLRPDDTCAPWELYNYQWIQQDEPPRIAAWDTNWENLGNAYITGVNIQCDTFGQTKTVQVFLDQTLLATLSVVASGRSFLQFPLPTPTRGSLLRFVATDSNPGLLYGWQWMSDPEPGTQANWNQNYTVGGTLSDKWVKGALLECDTFGQNKTVTFEVDGVVVNTTTVNTNGRRVVEVSFPQALGRVLRMIPTDANPGRLYTIEWIFDEEPLALSRWETQELDLESPGWKTMPTAWVTIKSVTDVTLTTTVYGQDGTVITTLSNVIPNTGGLKMKKYVSFTPNKGCLYKFVFTSASPFWLYRDESLIYVRGWGMLKTEPKQPFGNDDFNPRDMHHSSITSSRSGGGSSVL